MKARSLFLLKPYDLEWKSEEISELNDYEILIKSIAGAINIGSELPQFKGSDTADNIDKYPRMTGYENFSEVTKIGKVALLTILSCDSAKGVLKLKPKQNSVVLITGAGTMGLLTLFFLKEYYKINNVDIDLSNCKINPIKVLVQYS